MYKLYYSPGACSLAPHIVLEEIGVAYETELVSANDGKMTDTPEWRKINPKGRVPALTPVPGSIGGASDLLTEAHAILFYLARTHCEAGLLPADAAGEARCIEWMNWLSGPVHTMTFGQLLRPQRFVADQALFPAVRSRGMTNLSEQYDYIERLLADGRTWAVADQYSIVDPYLLVFYSWGLQLKLDMPGRFPAWAELTRRTAARPAVGRVLLHEGVSLGR